MAVSFCGEPDCEGEDRASGNYCPCRTVHYGVDEIMEIYLKERGLCKRIDGELFLKSGRSFVSWRELEKEHKQKLIANNASRTT